MSGVVIKLTDFNSDEWLSSIAMAQPPASGSVEAIEPCDVCKKTEEKLATLEAQCAEDVAAQLAAMQSRFDDQLRILQHDLEGRLQQGLSQCLTALFPALAETSLRQGLEAELQQSLMDAMPETLSVRVSPDVSDLIDVPSGVKLTNDPTLKGHVVEIIQGAARTRLDPDAILNQCLAHLKPATLDETSK